MSCSKALLTPPFSGSSASASPPSPSHSSPSGSACSSASDSWASASSVVPRITPRRSHSSAHSSASHSSPYQPSSSPPSGFLHSAVPPLRTPRSRHRRPPILPHHPPPLRPTRLTQLPSSHAHTAAGPAPFPPTPAHPAAHDPPLNPHPEPSAAAFPPNAAGLPKRAAPRTCHLAARWHSSHSLMPSSSPSSPGPSIGSNTIRPATFLAGQYMFVIPDPDSPMPRPPVPE